MPPSRRAFLKTAGCLTIGFCLGEPLFSFGGQELPRDLTKNPRINAWLEVLDNGCIRVLTGKLELGQGIRTAVAQVAAEELDLEMSQVEVLLAETGRTPDEGYTAGSNSIEDSAMAIRYAAAAARQRLLELAAQKLKVPITDLTMAAGYIILQQGRKRISFAEILDGQQLTDNVRLPVALKPKTQHRLVGKSIHRQDTAVISSGQPLYVQDLRFPGMVHACMVHPPSYGARLLHFDEQAVMKKMPGLLKIVINGSFLAVIAVTEYEAMKAQSLAQQHAKWVDGPPLPDLRNRRLADYIKMLPVKTEKVSQKGDMAALAAGTPIKAAYSKPYIMHGAIGPSCAVALYEQNKLDVWTHSQGVYPLRETLAKLLHFPAENIHVKGVPGSGCYGHNGADDVAADAALIAMAYPGKHVRLQWSREDEHAWEPYGSAMVMELAAMVDSTGRISHWRYALWSDTHGARPGGDPVNLLPAHYLEKPLTGRPSGYSGGAIRNAESYYTIPNQYTEAHFFQGPLRTSSMRSLGAYANIFAIESFMDELSLAAGKDPYEFRLQHLEDIRAKDVINKLRERTATVSNRQIPDDPSVQTGIGIAFSRYKNSASYCAVAARVAVNTLSGKVKVQKMWAVIDAGETINLDGIKNQTEGGCVQSASWTLMEQVQFDTKQVTSRNWAVYPVLRMNEAPEVEVTVIDRPEDPPLGAGEAAQGPAAAAIANACYRACGKRIRHLPILPAVGIRHTTGK
jgi:nicotinate dehydrogenase subunit B